jgi:fimbrial chaperone protein
MPFHCRASGRWSAGWVSRVATLALLLLAAAASAARAVTVSPSALYIDARTRSGVLTLVNTGTKPEEIEIDFAFGYPRLDSLGRVRVPLFTVAPDSEPSAMAWLRAFPRRLRLEPGQRQVVRILVQPPAGLAAGEYWARVLVRSRGATPPIEQQTEQMRLQIGVETVIATAISYRNGAVTTGLALTPVEAAPADSGVRFVVDLARTGNAAFLGRLQAELVGPDGARAGTLQEDIAVYRGMRRAFLIPVAQRPARWAGYSVRWTVDTERPDLPPEGPLPIAPVSGQVAVRSP